MSTGQEKAVSFPLPRTAFAACVEHTLLRPDARRADIERLCAEARQHSFHGVCVHGCWTSLAAGLLEDTDIKVITVAGFPLGAMAGDAKRYEVEVAVDDGAHEIDVVINIGFLKDGRNSQVLRELRDIVESADERPVKVILETALLTREEKIVACDLVVESGAKFVKTSTGFGPSGATVEDVRLLRGAVGPEFGVKASGGIRDLATARALLQAGANRLGTSSSVAILAELEG